MLLTHRRLLPATAIALGLSLAACSGKPAVTRLVVPGTETPPLPMQVQVTPASPRTDFRPALERLDRTPAGWSLQIRGDARPVLREEGGELVLDLPGARLARDLPALPAGTAAAEMGPEPTPGGVPQPWSLTAAVPSRMPAGGVRLRLPAPDTPHALYRTGPDRLELRVLPPGLAGKTIVLDPGHGGEEPGAVGTTGAAEKDVNLAVVLLLKPMLEQAGARVILTRTEDARTVPPDVARTLTSQGERTRADLAARSALANQAGADLFVSIHANGGPPGEGGTETFWTVLNLNASRSLHLAQAIQAQLVEALGLPDRGVKQRPFAVIRNTDAPAVLVELGFMTNARDEGLLLSSEGQRLAAAALMQGIRAYFTGA